VREKERERERERKEGLIADEGGKGLRQGKDNDLMK
jgi:hypothetical protein